VGGGVYGGEASGGARVWTHSATSVTEEVCVAPPSEVYRRVGPASLELGAGWVEVALAGCQAMGRPYVDTTAQTEVRVVEDPPDQVRAIESRRGAGGRGIGGRGWWKVGRGKVK
jgi:hypothetical protein